MNENINKFSCELFCGQPFGDDQLFSFKMCPYCKMKCKPKYLQRLYTNHVFGNVITNLTNQLMVKNKEIERLREDIYNLQEIKDSYER
uniref:RPOL9 domain-containing protein n=1 Tax=Parastrongyloides trichosuri TaxID=131310 RepID=A0A0N5A7J0_PARTI